jgi:hypothetical protein
MQSFSTKAVAMYDICPCVRRLLRFNEYLNEAGFAVYGMVLHVATGM